MGLREEAKKNNKKCKKKNNEDVAIKIVKGN